MEGHTEDMRTPLHVGASSGQREVVAILLEYGANSSARDSKGLTPYDLAVHFGHDDVAALLKR